MARKRKMAPKTTTWVVKSVESTWTSGARVTFGEVWYWKQNPDPDGDPIDATPEDHDEWDFCCQADFTLEMSADEAPVAGAHVRMTLEQV